MVKQVSVKDANNATQTIETLNPNGQTTMANSHPVTIASDQSSLPVTVGNTVAVSASSNLPVSVNNTVAVSASSNLPVSLAASAVTLSTRNTTGLGAMTAIPAASTNGTAIGSLPSNAVGCRMYLNSGDSVTFTIAATAPSSAPTAVFTISQATTGPNWDENLASGQMIYITAKTGSPLFRFF